ncbi:MAG: hypothetical protein N3D20_01675 [Candidatus Pacearchaeota archaeon]|nr:hypothetical protein [Candidatus Pacearchaeota archaeon]
MDITTIKLHKQTKARLDNLRFHKKDSYDDILQRILGILNICRVNPEKAKSKLMAIEKYRKRELKKRNLTTSHKSLIPQQNPQPY